MRKSTLVLQEIGFVRFGGFEGFHKAQDLFAQNEAKAGGRGRSRGRGGLGCICFCNRQRFAHAAFILLQENFEGFGLEIDAFVFDRAKVFWREDLVVEQEERRRARSEKRRALYALPFTLYASQLTPSTPRPWVVHHLGKHPANVIVVVFQSRMFLLLEIAAVQGKIEPDFGFGSFGVSITELADKMLRITQALAPSFGKIAANRA